jgi:hypothetical protein
VHQTSSSSNTTTAGLYLDASTGANATGKVMAETGASAMIGAGYYVNNSGSSSMKGSTTAVVSQLSAGGDMSRTASKDIVDTGTAISAGGNFRQTANTITSNAASDTSYGSSQQNSEGRVGMYAGASASASVSGGAAADASVVAASVPSMTMHKAPATPARPGFPPSRWVATSAATLSKPPAWKAAASAAAAMSI